MGFFDHAHGWQSIRVNRIGLPDPKEERCQGEIITQQCRCGAVRTVTVEPGIPPIIRYAKTVGE